MSEEAVLKRYNQGWVEEYTNNLDELIAKLKQYRREAKVTSLGYHGNVVDLWYDISCKFTIGSLLTCVADRNGTTENSETLQWFLVTGGEFPCQLSDRFWLKIWEIFSMWSENYYFTPFEIKPIWNQKWTLENLEKVKIPVLMEITFGSHLWSVVMLLAILDGGHYQKLQKWLSWLYRSTYKLVIKTKHQWFGIFNLNMLLAILDGYPDRHTSYPIHNPSSSHTSYPEQAYHLFLQTTIPVILNRHTS